MTRIVRRTPHISPGKKPAIIARGGKLLQSALGRAAAPLFEVVVAVALAPLEVRLGEVVAEAGEVVDALEVERTH